MRSGTALTRKARSHVHQKQRGHDPPTRAPAGQAPGRQPREGSPEGRSSGAGAAAPQAQAAPPPPPGVGLRGVTRPTFRSPFSLGRSRAGPPGPFPARSSSPEQRFPPHEPGVPPPPLGGCRAPAWRAGPRTAQSSGAAPAFPAAAREPSMKVPPRCPDRAAIEPATRHPRWTGMAPPLPAARPVLTDGGRGPASGHRGREARPDGGGGSDRSRALTIPLGVRPCGGARSSTADTASGTPSRQARATSPGAGGLPGVTAAAARAELRWRSGPGGRSTRPGSAGPGAPAARSCGLLTQVLRENPSLFYSLFGLRSQTLQQPPRLPSPGPGALRPPPQESWGPFGSGARGCGSGLRGALPGGTWRQDPHLGQDGEGTRPPITPRRRVSGRGADRAARREGGRGRQGAPGVERPRRARPAGSGPSRLRAGP